MSTFWLTAYVMMWPVLSTLVLITLCTALVRDIRKAKKDGESLV
ncbi:MAG TPA: putative transporter small subunit [Thiopseudomonas sp.]|nr:putative transporter small subunit [Thiopseudomonas sp.]